MNENIPLHPIRKYPASMPTNDFGHRSNIVFVTICTHNRKRILNTSAIHDLLIESWEMADAWLVGRYIILPEHIHLFCSPAKRDSVGVKQWTTYWKYFASKSWPNENDKPVWQRDVWDRQLRRGESYGDKWTYVRNNPVRHQLVDEPDQWPFQGELNTLRWHDV